MRQNYLVHVQEQGRDSSVGIATRYWLDGPGIESRWGRDFPHPYRPVLEPTQPPVQLVPDLSRGVKRPGRGVHHPPPSKAEVEERVELYICSPSGLTWPVLGRTSHIRELFLSVFRRVTKLRKASFSFIMSVCLTVSVRSHVDLMYIYGNSSRHSSWIEERFEPKLQRESQHAFYVQ